MVPNSRTPSDRKSTGPWVPSSPESTSIAAQCRAELRVRQVHVRERRARAALASGSRENSPPL